MGLSRCRLFSAIVVQSCLTFCDPMDCSTPDSTVLHVILEFAQLHVHWVSDFSCYWALALGCAPEHQFSCPAARGIFLNQGSTSVPCIGWHILKHWTTNKVQFYFKFFVCLFVCSTWLVESQFPEQDLNLGAWQWDHRVLTTGLWGNFLRRVLHEIVIHVSFVCRW